MSGSLRVLVVENHVPTRELLCTLLQDAGHSVTAASDGRTALVRIAHELPDLVLTDLRMPLLDGNELLKAMRTDPLLHDVAVVLVTAHPGYAAPGFDALVCKPFDADDLLNTIAAVRAKRHIATAARWR